MTQRVRRALRFATVVILSALTLVAWSFASPVGASPDDDFHLVSTWCAGPIAEEACVDDGDEQATRQVPRALILAPCYVADETASAACQEERLSWELDDTVSTQRGNFASGGYPPVYYAVSGLLAGPDVQVSALAMRLANAAVFLAFASVLFVLLPRDLRLPLVGGWLIATVPLGLFLLASNNPGSWALTGVAASWLSLAGWFRSSGRRKIALGVVFVLAVIVAAGARGDAAAYVGLAISLVIVLEARRAREFWVSTLLPLAMIVVAFLFFLSSRQVTSGVEGFGGGSEVAQEQLGEFGLLAYNILNVPWLWSGFFGSWGLGWTFTTMPYVVPLAATAAFVVVGAAGLSMISPRKAVIVGVTALALWALPVYVLQAGGDSVGANVSPRYLLPLGVLLAGFLLLGVPGRSLPLTRTLRITVAVALIGAHFVALHITIRRYVTGLDVGGIDLGSGAEWWWDGPIGPNAVWLLGSLAYALLVVLVLPTVDYPTQSTEAEQAAPTRSDAVAS